MRGALLLALCAALVGCGDAAAPGYVELGGTYHGSVQAVSQDYALAAELALTITQDRSALTGSWALDGQVAGPGGTTITQTGGTITGTLGSGSSPSVSVVLRPSACPAQTMTLSGTWDPEDEALELSGPLQVLSSTCGVQLTFQVTTDLS